MVVLLFICFVFGYSELGQGLSRADSASEHCPIFKKMSALQVPFIANKGKVDNKVSFYAKIFGGTLFVTNKGEMVYVLGRSPSPEAEGSRSIVFKERLFGAQDIRPEGREKARPKVNYFIGDQSNWKTGIPTYNKVTFGKIYRNIELSLKAYDKKVEKVFTVHPGGNVGDIKLNIEGAASLKVNTQGELVVNTVHGKIKFSIPMAYQEIEGERKDVQVAYDVKDSVYGFMVGEYDQNRPLIIDPTLSYSTYLGGGNDDEGYGIAVDGSGNVYVTGRTNSDDFPTMNAYQSSRSVDWDVFITKLNTFNNSLIYSTYLGGSGLDWGLGIAVDGSGNAYVTGYTQSNNFPTQSAYRGSLFGPNDDVFVTKLNATGSSLIYSTYLGGSDGNDRGFGIRVDHSGYAYVTGLTESSNFPTQDAYQNNPGAGAGVAGKMDVFVTKFNASGSALMYSTYLGGKGNGDRGYGIAVDGSENAYVTGRTNSTNFPTKNPYRDGPTLGPDDAFVAKIDTTQSGPTSLIYSTYLGGNNNDEGHGIGVDGSGNAYVTGYTQSNNFPTKNPLQGLTLGGSDAFVTKLNTTGSALIYSTRLGGGADDNGYGITVDSLGNAYITGNSRSTDFPTLNAYQGSFQGGNYDAFITKLNTAGTGLFFSTYLGGSDSDEGQGIAVSGSNAYITGITSSTDFPTKNPYQGNYQGGTSDAFIAKFNFLKVIRFYFGQAHNLED